MPEIVIWKDKILLKEAPPPPWPHIGEHAKYSERLGAYHLALSKQNLQRVYRQFGKIPVRQGQGRIEQLKAELSRFNKMMETAALAKTNPNLPEYNYKVKPIGPYQHRGVVYLVNVTRSPLFVSCGCGKTYMVACAVEQLIQKGLLARGKTLVCGKLATLHQGWAEDIRRFTNLKANILWVPGSYKRRERILKALADPADLYLINHDGARLLEKELADHGFQYVVVDESSVMRGYRSDRSKGGAFTKAVLRIAEYATRRTIMSGTPAPNGPQDLFGQMLFLDPYGFMLERSWRDFTTEHMNTVYFGDPNNPDTPKTLVIKPESIGKIANTVNPLAYRVRIEDALPDLPDLTIVKRMVSMSAAQATHYDEMLETLHTEIDTQHITVTIKLAQIQKLRQITGGFVIDTCGVAHPVEGLNPKIEMLDQLLEEEIAPEDKVIIWAHYHEEFKMLGERYKHHGIVTYYGETPVAQKLANLEAFIKDPKVRVIVLHPKSCAHGVTLTCSHYMVFLSLSHSSEDNYQCLHRIRRNSQKFPMIAYYLMAEGTIDEAMYDTVSLKSHQQAMLIDPDSLGADAEMIWAKLKEQVKRHKHKRRHSGS
jgi:SNF2 family DNA or RNA helicase